MNNFRVKKWRRFSKLFCGLFLGLHFATCLAMDVPVYDFSITPYSQNASDYLSANKEQNAGNLLSANYQYSQLKQFYNHYYASDAQGLSPWSAHAVAEVMPLVEKTELDDLNKFNNQNQSGNKEFYAQNFKELDKAWWEKIRDNMDLPALAASEYSAENRAISVANTFARSLPESAPAFLHPTLPGQGFPFDHLQESVIWAGTPLYVFTVSKDKAWSLVLTPDAYFAWVKSDDIAYTSAEFIHQWQNAARRGLVAVTRTEAMIVDDHESLQFKGFIGAVFPKAQYDDRQTSILIPVKQDNHQAAIKTGYINANAATEMPLVASRNNMVNIIRQLQNRPYGWGGAYFYNDCSLEMKSIFTPFGIWLPRNSGQQVKSRATLDLSTYSVDDRIALLKENGHPFMTIVNIGGHMMLYIGNKDVEGQGLSAMTYQNVWGMSPASHDKRYVIGQSVFLPLLRYYPDNPDVESLAARATFRLVYLDDV